MKNSIKIGILHFNLPLCYCDSSFLLTIINVKNRLKIPRNQSEGRESELELDRILASSCRTRIIRFLHKNSHVHVMQLIRKANSTYNQVNLNLQILREEGIIFDEYFGRTRVIRLNKENPRTTLLLQALKILDTPEDKM
jgi:predicted transcriptional regulator